MSNFIYPFLFKRLNLPKIVNVFTVHCFECFIFNGVQELLQYIKCLECYVIKNVCYTLSKLVIPLRIVVTYSKICI